MTARAWNRRLSHAEMRAAQCACVCVCVRWGWGGTLLVTWFIIRSCKVVRLEGIRDDKLDLTVGEEGGGGGLTHSWSKGGGVRKKILTARLTVLGPSVPFAVLWRKRCTKALLTPLFAPSLLRLPHTASFSSSFTGRFGCFFICKQLRAWCWADGRGFFFSFFCTLARIIPEAFEQSVRVDRHWEWEQDGPSGPQQPGRFGSEITVRLMSPFFFVLVWRMEGHVDYWLYMCCEKIWQKWLIKQGCLRCHYLKAPHKHTVTVIIVHFQIFSLAWLIIKHVAFENQLTRRPSLASRLKLMPFGLDRCFKCASYYRLSQVTSSSK